MRSRAGLAAGAILLLAANGLVLAGVARNRAAPPEARLALSEREMWIETSAIGDDTGRSVQLRISSEGAGYDELGAPWLDRAKLATLGFDVRLDPADRRAQRAYSHILPRPVFLVLELDGPTCRRVLAEAAARAAEPWLPGGTAAEKLDRLRRTASRLFAVDAGLDAAALRRRHPDRAIYAIAAGEACFRFSPPEKGAPASLHGWVNGPRIVRIDVPLPLARPFDALAEESRRRQHAGGPYQPPPFRATIAWGRRLEPWIVDLAPRPAAPLVAAGSADR